MTQSIRRLISRITSFSGLSAENGAEQGENPLSVSKLTSPSAASHGSSILETKVRCFRSTTKLTKRMSK